MVRVQRHGDVTRFEMSSVASRIVGYSASAYLVRGVLVDCGFPAARHHVDEILERERPRGVLITPFVDDTLELIAAPGHSADHHVVWDRGTGTLFGGDLYLGVKVRIAHGHEDPRLLAKTLRAVASLGPARLFDAHRGFVPDPAPLLLAKADWTEEMIAAIEKRIGEGADD